MASDRQFITRPMSLALDLVRTGAAMVVLARHAPQVIGYTGPFPLSDQAGHNAVVVFFVLSGLVIANSIRPTITLTDYTIARMARILPVSLLSLALGSLIFALSPLLPGNPMSHPADTASLTLNGTLAPALFLSESWFGSGPVWNPPYWSLCYEVWYYALFAAATFLRGTPRLAWLGLLALVAGPKVLLLFPIWLMGVWLAKVPVLRTISPAAGLVLLVACGAGFLLISSQSIPISRWLVATRGFDEHDFEFSKFVLTDLGLGVFVTLGFVALRSLAAWAGPWLDRGEGVARAGSGMSFTLYLLHWPLLCLLRSLGMNLGTSVVGFIGTLVGVVLVCAAIARVTEHRQKTLRSALHRLVRQRRTAPTATYA